MLRLVCDTAALRGKLRRYRNAKLLDAARMCARMLACRGGRDERDHAREGTEEVASMIFDKLNVLRVACCVRGKFDSPHVESYVWRMGVLRVPRRAEFPNHWNQMAAAARFWWRK